VIVDASVVLTAFLSDEMHQDEAHAVVQAHITDEAPLAAPTLLEYEVSNALLQATRQARITQQHASDILNAFARLSIDLQPIPPQVMFDLANALGRSAYDASYLALAQLRDQPLITADRKLYNAVHKQFDLILWIGDYS